MFTAARLKIQVEAGRPVAPNLSPRLIQSISAFLGIAGMLYRLVCRSSGRKTAAHFCWNCFSNTFA
jgi:hypothetical protein